jgi:hypothetical protein
MTPSSTTKNVRDIITAVENMYECVNSPSSNCDEMNVLSSKPENTKSGIDANDIKDMKQINSHLSDIVLSSMTIQGKTRCDDMTVPEPPRRSKPRNNKLNPKLSSRNSNSSTVPSVKPSTENDCSLTPDTKYLNQAATNYEAESKLNNNITNTTSSRPTAMDLAVACAGGKRSMWAELREVVNSGV